MTIVVRATIGVINVGFAKVPLGAFGAGAAVRVRNLGPYPVIVGDEQVSLASNLQDSQIQPTTERGYLLRVDEAGQFAFPQGVFGLIAFPVSSAAGWAALAPPSINGVSVSQVAVDETTSSFDAAPTAAPTAARAQGPWGQVLR